MFNARVLLDSIHADTSVRVTTAVVTHPLPIHAEFMTHRAFSRNAGSSRAIPSKVMLERVRNDLFLPVHYGINTKGMQAKEEASPEVIAKAKDIIRRGSELMIREVVEPLLDLNLHKQLANRYLAPFSWIEVVVTTISFDNYIALRFHDDAQPEICVPTEMLLGALNNSTPTVRRAGEWHLPFAQPEDFNPDELAAVQEDVGRQVIEDIDQELMGPLAQLGMFPQIKDLAKAAFSSARTARVSIACFDGRSSLDEDFRLYCKLARATPKHASPMEHPVLFTVPGAACGLGGNLTDPKKSIAQFRKMLKREKVVRDPRMKHWRVEDGVLVED